MNLEGTYKVDKVNGQLILELALTPDPTEDREEFETFSRKMVGALKQINVDHLAPERLTITLGLMPVEEPEFDGEGPTKEELAAEFAALPKSGQS